MVVELISLWKPPYQIVFDVWETLTLLFPVFVKHSDKAAWLSKCQNFTLTFKEEFPFSDLF